MRALYTVRFGASAAGDGSASASRRLTVLVSGGFFPQAP
jgi:hypothetical protein